MLARWSQNTVFQDEILNYEQERNSVLSLGGVWNTVRVPSYNSSWLRGLEAKFNELTSLPVGWDGYKGQPVSFSCAKFSADLIERLYVPSISIPQIIPGSDGSLQIEWHENQFDIEIDVLKPYKVIATRFDLISEEEEEMEFEADFTKIYQWVIELAENREIKQQAGG